MKGDKIMTNGRWNVVDKWINRILLLIGVIYFAWHVASKEDIKTLREELLKDNKQIREDNKQLRDDMNRQFHELSARMDKSRNELQADIQRIEDDYKDHLAKHND